MAKAKKEEAPAKRGREPKWTDNAKIKVLIKENPKRGASAERFEGYKGAKTVGQARANGVTNGDLAWDFERGYVAIDGDSNPLKERKAPAEKTEAKPKTKAKKKAAKKKKAA